MKGVCLITICKFETNLLVLHKGQTGIVFGQICLHTSYLHAFNEHAVWNHPSLHKDWMSTFLKEQIAWISKPLLLSKLFCMSSTLLGKMAVDPCSPIHDLLVLPVTMSAQYISLCPSFSVLIWKNSEF